MSAQVTRAVGTTGFLPPPPPFLAQQREALSYTSRTFPTISDPLWDPWGSLHRSGYGDPEAARHQPRTPDSLTATCFLLAPSGCSAMARQAPKTAQVAPTCVFHGCHAPHPTDDVIPSRGSFPSDHFPECTAVLRVFITPELLKVTKLGGPSPPGFSKEEQDGSTLSTSSLHRRLPAWQAATTTAHGFW